MSLIYVVLSVSYGSAWIILAKYINVPVNFVSIRYLCALTL